MRHIDFLRQRAEPLRDGLHGWNGMAIEREYAELIYSLVRAQRPRVVLETGAGEGIASTFIATALKENGTGRLTTFEPIARYWNRAHDALEGLPADVIDRAWTPDDADADMVFIDSGSETRQAEIDFWIENDPAILLIVHDANRGYGLDRGEGTLLARGDGLWIGRSR